MSQQPSSPHPDNPLIIGIDWADREHEVCFIDGQKTSRQSLPQDPDVIAQWRQQLRNVYGDRPILVAIEQSRGALVHALQDADGLQIYPVNPKQLARFREAIYPAGGKSDPRDAELLAMFLLNHRQKLRAWQPDNVETRKLAYLAELRRKLVDDRKSLGLRLTAFLKLYFPLALTLFNKTSTSEFLLDLLKRWPSLEQLKRAHPKALREFFTLHHVRDDDRQTNWFNAIRAATPLTRDKALIESHALYVTSLVRQIAELNRAVTEFDDQLRTCVAQHPDNVLFRAVPGAGDALVPRLIAAFGSDRDRYKSAEDLQAFSGIAPIAQNSGKSSVVVQRIFCPHFLKQTFHEFADQARRWSAWSKAFYDLKKSQGMKHHAAVRTLAFKWIRILFVLWKNRATYSETQYLQRLRQKQSPLIPFLPKI